MRQAMVATGVDPLINLQDPAAKVVGKRKPPRDSFKAGMDLQDTVAALCQSQRKGLAPKGVVPLQLSRGGRRMDVGDAGEEME